MCTFPCIVILKSVLFNLLCAFWPVYYCVNLLCAFWPVYYCVQLTLISFVYQHLWTATSKIYAKKAVVAEAVLAALHVSSDLFVTVCFVCIFVYSYSLFPLSECVKSSENFILLSRNAGGVNTLGIFERCCECILVACSPIPHISLAKP